VFEPCWRARFGEQTTEIDDEHHFTSPMLAAFEELHARSSFRMAVARPVLYRGNADRRTGREVD
jgi:hypothetical protein